jgi:UDP:flavonoid glycosyltransferase YjiC (YdhE family)
MKVLLTCQPALGHLHPMAPLAQALQAAGHEAAFVTSASFCPCVREAGFPAISAGLDWLESEVDRAFPDLAVDPTIGNDLDRVWKTVFARAAQVFVPDLIRILRSYRPDLLVSESIEYSGPLAAEAVGIPHAVLGIGACQPRPVLAWEVGRYWNSGRTALGLADDPNLERLCPYLYLDAYPPSMHPMPIGERTDVAHSIRPVPYEVGEAAPPKWLEKYHDRPTIYVTMGTVFNRIEGAFSATLAAIRDEPVNVIVTVGPGRDPRTLGPQPAHVRVERYVPQSAILPSVDLVVSHAGYNTTVAALVNGLPMLALPLGADQHYNAFRVAACGAGIQLDPRTATPERVGEAIRELLGNVLYRRNAERLRREIAAMPPIEVAVGLLERLASDWKGRLSPQGRLHR